MKLGWVVRWSSRRHEELQQEPEHRKQSAQAHDQSRSACSTLPSSSSLLPPPCCCCCCSPSAAGAAPAVATSPSPCFCFLAFCFSCVIRADMAGRAGRCAHGAGKCNACWCHIRHTAAGQVLQDAGTIKSAARLVNHSGLPQLSPPSSCSACPASWLSAPRPPCAAPPEERKAHDKRRT